MESTEAIPRAHSAFARPTAPRALGCRARLAQLPFAAGANPGLGLRHARPGLSLGGGSWGPPLYGVRLQTEEAAGSAHEALLPDARLGAVAGTRAQDMCEYGDFNAPPSNPRESRLRLFGNHLRMKFNPEPSFQKVRLLSLRCSLWAEAHGTSGHGGWVMKEGSWGQRRVCSPSDGAAQASAEGPVAHRASKPCTHVTRPRPRGWLSSYGAQREDRRCVRQLWLQ